MNRSTGRYAAPLVVALLLSACGTATPRARATDAAPQAIPQVTPQVTSASTPAATPPKATAATTSSGWRMVAQFKGHDGGITKPFTTTNWWRLTFLIEDSLVLAIRTYPEGKTIRTLPLFNQRLDGKPHVGAITITLPGTYALDLSPWGYYQIDIEEIVRKPPSETR